MAGVKINEYAERVRTPSGGGLPMARPVAPDVSSSVRALSDFRHGARDLAYALKESEDEQARAWSANALAESRLRWSTEFVKRQTEAKPGAPDFTESLLKDYDQYQQQTLAAAPNDASRFYLNERLTAFKSDLGNQGVHYEAQARVDYKDDEYRKAADNVAKLMNTDPKQYHVALAELLAAIDGAAMPQVKKSARREATIRTVSASAVWSQIQRSPTEFLNSIGFGGPSPVLRNPDGSVSTESTIGIEADGKHYVIPTIIDGQRVQPEQAVAAWKGGSNKEVGVFGTQAEADQFARARSAAGGKLRRTSGDVLGITGNAPFDALPFEVRTQMFDQALRAKNQIDVDADRATAARKKEMGENAMKEGWSLFYSGKLSRQFIEQARPLINDNDYKALLEAQRKGMGEGRGQKTDPGTFRKLQEMIYTGQYQQAESFAYSSHKSGLLSNEHLSSNLERIRGFGRTEGPKSEFERTRAYVRGSLEPSPLIQDPVQRSRMAEALDEYDRWYSAGPNGVRPDDEVKARGRELVQQYVFVDLGSSVAALPFPRGTTLRRTPDISALETDIRAAGAKLQRDQAAGKLQPHEYQNELATLNRWRNALETARRSQPPVPGKK